MAFPDKNPTLGSGELYFAPFAPTTRVPLHGQEYFGNTTEINLATESETLDHFDTDHGTRTKDDSALLEKNLSGSFVTDQISPANLSKWFTGPSSVVSQTAAAATAETFLGVRPGGRYQIGRTTNNPSGLRGLANMLAVKVGTPNVNLIVNVDIRYDTETGSFTILPGSLLVAADGSDDVIVTYDVLAVSYNRVISGSEANLEGEMFYKSFNAKGVKFDYYFPYVQLAPDGDFALKGDDWQAISFTFQALQRDNSTAAVYTNGRPGVAV